MEGFAHPHERAPICGARRPSGLAREGTDNTSSAMTARRLLGHPSAFVPIALSLALLAFLLGFVAVFGVGGDEGTPARIPIATILYLET